MNNFLVIPGDGFWCQKGGHPSDCFSLKLSLQFIRQPLINPLSVCSLRFGNKHAILMTNVATPNMIRYSSRRSIIPITLHKNYISRTQNNTLFIFAAVYGHSSATSAVFSSIPNSPITVHHVISDGFYLTTTVQMTDYHVPQGVFWQPPQTCCCFLTENLVNGKHWLPVFHRRWNWVSDTSLSVRSG